MRAMMLTPRLEKVAGFVTGKTVADIGTDHGKLLIFLAQKGKMQKGIGSDVAKGPASACANNVAMHNLSDVIEIRVGDGLKTLVPGEVETVAIAGMGGELIAKILAECPDVVRSVKEFILQPMTNSDKLLKVLHKLGIKVMDGALVQEGDKLYRIYKCEQGAEKLSDFETVICPAFKGEPLLKTLIEREKTKAEKKLLGLQSGKADSEAECEKLRALIKELNDYEVK
ncbi:MAG: SAM-dependent methyltransferase [Clostridia bacterium]|nr:SAM-dependent methyltransferase [Clostridia bacterium]